MLLLWILLILAALILLRYFYLISKRMLLVYKFKRNHPTKLVFVRNPLFSVLVPDGKIDLIVQTSEKTYYISVMTTPFRWVRYHFSEDQLEIIMERKATHVTNLKIPQPNGGSFVNNRFPIKKYSLNLKQDIPDSADRYIILHPAPKSVSAVNKTQLVSIVNNDFVTEHIRACGLQYFLKNILK
ncbi:MAG: hypothetical protein E7616_05795 [Ruminococcaceae bacterium]|nr:hypothetical protein [Oscillospiraceae bacterium]